jgi:hypothetical protein
MHNLKLWLLVYIAQGKFWKTIDKKNIHTFANYFHIINDNIKHIACCKNNLVCHMVLMCCLYTLASALKRQIFNSLSVQTYGVGHPTQGNNIMLASF